MLTNSGSWYPQDYYSLVAVEFFIEILVNEKPTTVSEMIEIYDREKQGPASSQELEYLNYKFEKHLAEPQEIQVFLREANVLALTQIFTLREANKKQDAAYPEYSWHDETT